MNKNTRPKVLAVDDEPWNLKLLESKLVSLGVDFSTAACGEECLKLAREKTPDLILLDIQMPEMDGIEVCRQIKGLLETKNIPIIFVTAFSDVENQTKAIEAGAQGFITKPVQDALLTALVQNVLQVKSLSDEVKAMMSDRSALTNMLIHDINNLIAVASLSCDGLLEDPTLSPQIKKRISMAFRASENIKNMTGSLLDLEKMESASLTVSLGPLDFHELVRERMEFGQARGSELKGIKFKTNFTDGRPIVFSDRGLLVRVIDNFITNAIKYATENSTIEFGTTMAGGDCVFFIANDGPPVPTDYHQRIFEKYGQVEAWQSKERKGVGLGLAFCKMALEQMGGNVNIESPILGRSDGVKFFVHLPTDLKEHKTVNGLESEIRFYGQTIPGGRGAERLKVLVVDDDIESVIPLDVCLKKFNCDVKIVNTGYAAIHEMLSEDKNYDVVILDWLMPDLSGKQTLVNAQEIIFGAPSILEHWKRNQIPVITFSGYERGKVVLPKFKNFRFLDHWAKPTEREQLLEKISETFTNLKSDSPRKGT